MFRVLSCYLLIFMVLANGTVIIVTAVVFLFLPLYGHACISTLRNASMTTKRHNTTLDSSYDKKPNQTLEHPQTVP